MRRSRAAAVLAAVAGMTPEQRRVAVSSFPAAAIAALAEEWWWRAHGGQREPVAANDNGPWRVWAIVAGRGFGKTRAGAEWIWARAREDANARIALVAATQEEAARVMVEGESGLLAIARIGEEARWVSSRGILHFPSGAKAFVYSAERPEALRGPEHHFAWADELAKWPHAEATWNNLMLGLRLGERPRTIVTTTPKPVPLLKRLVALPHTANTKGRTDENPHLPEDFKEAVSALYGGTRLGRQELEGLLLEDVPGALWTREMLDKARVDIRAETQRRRESAVDAACSGRAAALPYDGTGISASPGAGDGHGLPAPLRLCANHPSFTRTVIGVDPPASAHGDSCGIVVCALAPDGNAYVLADLTVAGERPEGWARRVAAAAEAWDAQKVVAEKNQGGDMVESVLRAAAFGLPVKLVAATKGKAARAEPIALHFETGRARLAGDFPDLEDQLCGLTYAGYEGPGASPDRADAMVWAMTELFAKQKAEPRIRFL